MITIDYLSILPDIHPSKKLLTVVKTEKSGLSSPR